MRPIPPRLPALPIALLLLLACALSPFARAEAPPARTLAEESTVLAKGRLSARQNAFARLALSPEPGADALLLDQFERFERGELPIALWLDLFEAAAKRPEPRLKARLARHEEALQKSPDLPSRFRECLEGGNGEKGRVIFTQKPEAGCVRCHTVDGEGGKIGPDLTWLRHSVERIHLLESILQPSATIATGFQSALLTLKNGETLSGILSAESADEITLTSVADGSTRTLKSADVEKREPLPSPMPPAFSQVLSKRDIRDLIQFLAEGD